MRYDYVALNNVGKEVKGKLDASDTKDAIEHLKGLGFFPTKIVAAKETSTKGTKTMTLSQALKQKNRLAGELVRNQEILRRENARRSDSVSKVDRQAVWDTIQKLSDELGALKGRITQANVGIYTRLERMAELKSRIAYVTNLPKREGEEVQFVGRDQEKLTYTWDSLINQQEADEMITELQKQIDALQDEVDAFNATTKI